MEVTITGDIPIVFANLSGQTDIQVVVFVANSDPKIHPYVAWEIIKGHRDKRFIYPGELSVGVTYKDEIEKIIVGPFPAKVGSTWEICPSDFDPSSLRLSEIHGGCPNAEERIVVRNNSDRCPFDVGVYKHGKLLVVAQNAYTSDHASFNIIPVLNFGVVRKTTTMNVGDVFKEKEIISPKEFNLRDFTCGLQVILTQNMGPGENYIFEGYRLENATNELFSYKDK